MIEVCIQYFLVCICSETLYTFNWTTPISIYIFIAFVTTKYINFYLEHKSWERIKILKALCITIFTDIKRIGLCIGFFYEGYCVILILIPIIFQTLSLIVFILCSNTKNKINKAICAINELFVLLFCICCTFYYPCTKLYTDFGTKIVGLMMELSLIILISIEGIIICVRDYYTIKNSIKMIRNTKIKPLNISLENSKCIDEEEKSPKYLRRSKKKQSCGIDIKLFELQSETKAIHPKDKSMRIEDIENSMNNICDCSEIIKIQDEKQSSNVVRLKQSRYGYEEVNEDDIIPKIGIIEYDSFSSISKNKSNYTVIAPLGLDEKLSVLINLPHNIIPKSARDIPNYFSDKLSSNENHEERILNSEVLYPTWRKKSANKHSDESYRLSRFSINSCRSQKNHLKVKDSFK